MQVINHDSFQWRISASRNTQGFLRKTSLQLDSLVCEACLGSDESPFYGCRVSVPTAAYQPLLAKNPCSLTPHRAAVLVAQNARQVACHSSAAAAPSSEPQEPSGVRLSHLAKQAQHWSVTPERCLSLLCAVHGLG